jgi:hypothetical protein
MNIPKAIANLQHLTTAELAAEFEGLFGSRPRYRSPGWMRKRIAQRLQENAFGGMSAPARAELERLAGEISLPDAAPRANGAGEQSKKVTTPRAGTVLQREWRGQQIRVEVLRDGVAYKGERFKSLSAVAKHITGQHWSGPRFFHLTGRKDA